SAGAGARPEHVPRCPGRSHRPLVHALLQHTSSTQKPVEHCDGVIHAPPWGTGVFVGVAVGVLVAVAVLVGVFVGVSVGVNVAHSGSPPELQPSVAAFWQNWTLEETHEPSQKSSQNVLQSFVSKGAAEQPTEPPQVTMQQPCCASAVVGPP